MFESLAATVLVLAISVSPTPKVEIDRAQEIPQMETADYSISKTPKYDSPELLKKKIIASINTSAELEAMFSRYSSEYGVNKDLLKKIAACESGFNSGANNGVYGGMYQYLAGTWSSTRSAMGQDNNPDLRYNAEEAIKTTAYKLSLGGASAWPNCSRT